MTDAVSRMKWLDGLGNLELRSEVFQSEWHAGEREQEFQRYQEGLPSVRERLMARQRCAELVAEAILMAMQDHQQFLQINGPAAAVEPTTETASTGAGPVELANR